MDDETLSLSELEFLLESLRYSEMKFEATEYPSYAMRRATLDQIATLRGKLRLLRDRVLNREQTHDRGNRACPVACPTQTPRSREATRFERRSSRNAVGSHALTPVRRDLVACNESSPPSE